jgi:hypothetical protein
LRDAGVGYEAVLDEGGAATVPLDAARRYGGADFDPWDRSDDEVMRFCQIFMTQLSGPGRSATCSAGTSASPTATSPVS